MRGSIGLLLLTIVLCTTRPCGAAKRLVVTFSGTVSDPSGKPAAGAVVVLNMWAPSTTSRDWRRSPERHRVTADARGAFTLEVPLDGDDWEATLLALKPGYGSTGQRLYSPGSTRDLRLILSRSGSIAGRVLDPARH